MSDLEDVPEPTEKDEIMHSWISRCIEPCPNTGVSSASSCPFGNTGVHQHAFTTRIVQRNDDPRTLLPILKGVLFSKLEAVLFDPKVDPDNDACFNCRKVVKHTYKRCREPTIYNFCRNCGRRGVEITDCPRCAKGNEEYEQRQRGRQVRAMPPKVDDRFRRDKSRGRGMTPRVGEMPQRDKSRARSDASRLDSQHSSRSRTRNTLPLEQSDLRDKSRGRLPHDYTQFDQNSSGGRERKTVMFESRNSRDKSRGRMRNELYDSRNSRDKSRYRDKNVTWSDSENVYGAYGSNKYDERKNHEEGNSIRKNIRYQDNGEIIYRKDEKLTSNEESGNNITRQYLDLMDSIKHLPGETQNEMVKLFLKEREALINHGAGGGKLE